MNIRILQLIEGVRKATCLTVVIDVFRSFSVTCYVFENGARMIIPVGDVEKAYELKQKNPDYILIGERGGRKPSGFDYGNSPTQIENVNFLGKVVIQTTTAGTKGLMNAKDADEIITGSFVNAQAVIDYIVAKNPKKVSLVCMGKAGVSMADEDTLCAEYIKDSLENKQADFQRIVSYLRNYETAKKFFDPNKVWAPERDFKLCLSINKFSFILKAKSYIDDLICLEKIERCGENI